MSTARPSQPAKRIKAARRPTGDHTAIARLAGLFRSGQKASASSSVQVIDSTGQRLDVPQSIADVIVRAADLMAAGRTVSVVADDEMLTTQQAADQLNVSRQYVVRLIDRGDLPAVKVGSHRRVRPADVGAFKATRDKSRDAALDRLAAVSEEIGGYGLAR